MFPLGDVILLKNVTGIIHKSQESTQNDDVCTHSALRGFRKSLAGYVGDTVMKFSSAHNTRVGVRMDACRANRELLTEGLDPSLAPAPAPVHSSYRAHAYGNAGISRKTGQMDLVLAPTHKLRFKSQL